MAGISCHVHNVTQTSPSTGVSVTHALPHGAEVSRFSGDPASLDGHSESSINKTPQCKSLKDVHISARLTEDFLDLANENTKKSLETCGVLGAFLEERTFYVTNLIIPKQESTPNSTHPSQSCFMSSIDLHTQHSYQVMVPEAVGIVVAPNDKSRRCGIFRLSDPVGMSILKECKERGFHSHAQPTDGSSIYEDCCNVYINPNLRLEVCDLR